MRFSLVIPVILFLLNLFEYPIAQDQPEDSSLQVASIFNPDILSVARELGATKYSGFRYGSNLSRKQIDCTQFMQAVIERVVGRELTQEESRAVLISGLPSGAKKLDSLVASEDERTSGVRYALTKILPIGKTVPADSAKSGDLIQYWIKALSGHYAGHTAIIESVERRGNAPVAKLYGSHKTLGRIGTAVDRQGDTLQLKLSGKNRKVYLVRIDPELLASARARASHPAAGKQQK